MVSIVKLFWDICLFRTGPEAVPAYSFLLITVLVIDATLSIVAQLALYELQLITAASLVMVNLSCMSLFIYILLTLMKLPGRFTQTLTAIVGADILLTLITVGALGISMQLGQLVVSIVQTSSLFWTLAVFGFIYHKAMDIHVGFGIALAFASFLITITIGQAVIS